jgi:hypothetical protein
VRRRGPRPRAGGTSLSVLAVLLLAAVSPARAAADSGGRYAVVIGANAGDPSEPILRYAESDARRIGDVLRDVGGFFPEDVAVLTGVRAEDVRRALIRLNVRLRQHPEGALLFVFYSGHADAEAVHLAGTRLGMTELRDLTAGSPASARVLVVDACRSGALTRVKGGRAGPSFQISVDAPSAAQGLAILTSSAAGEDAQESDQLQASIFTHHLLSGLLGAADRDRDGRVSLDEAFGYASERTLASTAFTLPGPQHPTYRLELGGRVDLVLTQPGLKSPTRGTLIFAREGSYLVQSGNPDGPIVAEIVSGQPGGQLAVEAGRYFVSERNHAYLGQGAFEVSAGLPTVVAPGGLRRVEYARVVRKGAATITQSIGAFALAGVRGDFLDLGPAWGTQLGGRIDLRPLSVELRLGLGRSATANSRLGIQTYEVDASLVGLHVFDLDRVSLGLGIEIGAALIEQRFSDGLVFERHSLSALLAPLLQLEVPVGRRSYARIEGAFVTYLLTTQRDAGTSTISSYRLGAGGGVYF